MIRALSNLPFTPSAPDAEYGLPRVGTLLLIGFFSVVFWALFIEAVRFAIHAVWG